MKKPMSIIILGIICVVAVGPVFRQYFTSIGLLSRTGITITEDSDDGIAKAFNWPITLGEGQKVTIRFSASDVNVSVALKILEKADFDANLAANSSSGSYTGTPFIYSRPEYGDTYVYDDTNSGSVATINQEGFWLIEFAGTTDSNDYLVSIPGTYVIVVYGTNDTDLATNENIRFNLKVDIEFPGRLIAFIAELAGWSIIAIAGTAMVVAFFKNALGGRETDGRQD